MLAITEMTPRPPTAITGSVRLSSPDRTANSGPQARTTCVTWSRDPDASLTPTMFLQSRARRARVSVSTLAAGRLDDDPDDSAVLLVGQRRRLARRPARHDAVGAVGDLELHQFAELWLVHQPVPERRHQRHDRALEHRPHGMLSPATSSSYVSRRRTMVYPPPPTRTSAARGRAL